MSDPIIARLPFSAACQRIATLSINHRLRDTMLLSLTWVLIDDSYGESPFEEVIPYRRLSND